jgi:hypothetical protein
MALRNIPTWTIRPNWSSGVLERLEWLTSVLQSPSYAEQRIQLRQAPRRSFEFSTLLAGPERTLFDLGVSRVGRGDWYLPIWHDVAITDAAVSAGGSTTIRMDTAGRAFTAGGALVLMSRKALQAETLEIAAVYSDAVVVSSPPTRSWPKGTRAYPARIARLGEEPKPVRISDRVETATVRFDVQERDTTLAAPLPDTYRGFPVLLRPPNETGSLDREYARLLKELDNGTGKPLVVDTAGFPTRLQKMAWMLRGHGGHAEVRSLLHVLRGKLVPAWMPTFAADFDLVETAEAGHDAITVTGCGFTAFGGPQQGRSDIRIQLRDGTSLFTRILSSEETSAGDERLVLESPLPRGFSAEQVRRISFMEIMRLDQDSVEISHETDEAGVSTVVTTFRSTPESRIAADWSPPELPMKVMTPGTCGEPPPSTPQPGPVSWFAHRGEWPGQESTPIESGAVYNDYVWSYEKISDTADRFIVSSIEGTDVTFPFLRFDYEDEYSKPVYFREPQGDTWKVVHRVKITGQHYLVRLGLGARNDLQDFWTNMNFPDVTVQHYADIDPDGIRAPYYLYVQLDRLYNGGTEMVSIGTEAAVPDDDPWYGGWATNVFRFPTGTEITITYLFKDAMQSVYVNGLLMWTSEGAYNEADLHLLNRVYGNVGHFQPLHLDAATADVLVDWQYLYSPIPSGEIGNGI